MCICLFYIFIGLSLRMNGPDAETVVVELSDVGVVSSNIRLSVDDMPPVNEHCIINFRRSYSVANSHESTLYLYFSSVHKNLDICLIFFSFCLLYCNCGRHLPTETVSDALHGVVKLPVAVQVKLIHSSRRATLLVLDTTCPLLSVH